MKQSNLSSIVLENSNHWPKPEKLNEWNKNFFHPVGTIWPIYVRKKGKSLIGNIRCENENIKQMHNLMLFIMQTRSTLQILLL